MDVDVVVHEVAPTNRYRTHIRGVANEAGHFGIYASRSHDIIPISDCLIAGEELHVEQIALEKYEPMEPIEVPQGDLQRSVLGKQLLVKAGAFWQRHRNAPETLTTQFLKLANLKAGDHLLDLYGGVGLFTSVALDVIGPGGRVDLIESSIPATESAKENFKKHENVKILREDVVKGLKNIRRADVVVLDPPRAGAGAAVVAQLLRIKPSRIVYIACDPASLARDVKDFVAAGWVDVMHFGSCIFNQAFAVRVFIVIQNDFLIKRSKFHYRKNSVAAATPLINSLTSSTSLYK